jgi:hypothetical protein
MKARKPKTAEPQKLSFVADLQADWDLHSQEIIEALRANPTKYAEILSRLAVAERLSPTKGIDFNEAKSAAEIAVKLLQSVGFVSPDQDSIEEAIKLNDQFIAQLQRIRDCAQAPEDEIH